MAQLNLGKVRGLSAYEIAVKNGYKGTEEEWVNYLKAIDGTRATLNEKPLTNVDFKERKVVQDGLVSSEVKLTNVIAFIKTPKEISLGVTYDILNKYDATNSIGWKIYIKENGDYWFGRSTTLGTVEWKTTGVKWDSEDLIIVFDDGSSFTVYKNSLNNVVITKAYSSNTEIACLTNTINKMYAYKTLTQQEIQHNLSVLNNSPSISSVETTDSEGHKTSFLFATNTDNVQTRTGHTEEERYTALLSKFGKKFTSTGEDITVENGIENQRVLGTVIKGQTVKNIANSAASFSVESDRLTITDTGNYDYNGFTFKNLSNKPLLIHIYSVSPLAFKTTASIGAGEERVFNNTNETVRIIQGKFSDGWENTENSKSEMKKSFIAIETSLISSVKSYIPFGLSSTQAILTNNGLKYSFYKDAEDKAQGKVIELGNGTTLTINEDGSGTLVEEWKTRVLDSSEDWIMSLDLGNCIRFGLTSKLGGIYSSCILCNYFEWYTGSDDKEGVKLDSAGNNIFITISKSKLTTQDVAGFKTWLQANPVTIRYQLATPIITTIPKEIMPTILTQATNTFTFGDGVKPSGVEITVPVDKVADLEQRLSALELLTNTVSVQSAYAEEVYADCLDKLNTL